MRRAPPRYSYPNQTIPEYFLPDKTSENAWKMGPPPAFVSKSNSEASSFGRRNNNNNNFSRGASLQSEHSCFSCSSPIRTNVTNSALVVHHQQNPLSNNNNTNLQPFRVKTPSPPPYSEFTQ